MFGEKFKMNKGVLLLLGLFLITGVFALPACSDTNEQDISDIPCEGLTPVIGCTGNVSIINLNTTARSNLTTYPIGDSRYNFTLNLTEGSYSLVDCANNSATVIVGDFPRDDLWKTAIILGIVGIAFILIILAKTTFSESSWMIKTFLYISASLITLLSINIGLLLSRVDNIDTLMTVSMTISIVTISIFTLYILIYYTIGIVAALKESKEAEYSDI